jgi:dihydrofolate reductase
VLGSQRPAGTPDHVVTDSDPVRLLERLREANQGGDVHLVGGPRTMETFRALGALDKLELVVLPVLFGAGMPAACPRAMPAGLRRRNSGIQRASARRRHRTAAERVRPGVNAAARVGRFADAE